MNELIDQALEKNKLIIVMTQCREGMVSDTYEAGKNLISKGAILASDMTREACLAKTSYLLGKNIPIDKIKILMALNLKGELTEKIDFNDKN